MVTSIESAKAKKPKQRVSEDSRYPVYTLDDSVVAARAVHEQGGGRCTPDQLAAFLRYSTTNSGAWLSRLSSARHFGLIQNDGRFITITPLALRIISPEYEEDAAEARAEAFLAVPLYGRLFQRYQGSSLPAEAGLRNAMVTTFGIPEGRTATAYKVLMESADQAGFFAARGGVRTHLVRPVLGPRGNVQVEEQPVEDIAPLGFGNGNGGGGEPPTGGVQPKPSVADKPPLTMDSVRLEYVRKLISLLGQEGVDQADLMGRIEKLLEIEGIMP